MRLPFLDTHVDKLYGTIEVPHPLELGIWNDNQTYVLNDLKRPGCAYQFEVPHRFPIAAPSNGHVAYTKKRFWTPLNAEKAHETNIVVLALQEGGAVRIEHIKSNLALGERVHAGQEIGRTQGYRGEPHIHLYFMHSVNDGVPNFPILFTNVPKGKENAHYSKIETYLEKEFPGKTLNERRYCIMQMELQEAMEKGEIRKINALTEDLEIVLKLMSSNSPYQNPPLSS